MTLGKRLLASAPLIMLIVGWSGLTSADETADWSKRHHAYIEKCGKYDGDKPKEPCRLVYYSMAKDDRIALQLKNPHKAAAIPRQIEEKIKAKEEKKKDKELVALAKECGVTDGKLLEYEVLEDVNLKIASYEVLKFALYKVNGDKCRGPGKLLWIANKLTDKIDDVELGGLIVRKSNDSTLYLYPDEVSVRIREKIEIPLNNRDNMLLEAGQLELVSPDPFDPNHRLLLRTKRSEQLSLARDPMLRTDVLTCAVLGASKADPNPGWCEKRGEEYLELWRAENREELQSEDQKTKDMLVFLTEVFGGSSEAAKEFRKYQPISILPNLIPISTNGPHSGFDDWLKAQKAKEDKFSGEVTVNSISNRSKELDNSTLSVGFKTSRGSYPGELEVKVGAQVEFGKDKVEEDVTKLLVSYDRYFKPWIEAYGFVERFTNNFMSIDERWEGGIGVLFEYDVRRRNSRDTFCHQAGYGYFGNGREIRVTKTTQKRIDQYKNRIRQELFRKKRITQASQTEYCKYKRGIEKRNAFLQLGLALSGFVDFEEPDALTVTATLEDEEDENPATFEVTPPATQIFRFSARPTVTLRPHHRVTLETWYYLKWNPNPDEEDDKLYESGEDFRSEWVFQAELRLNDGDPKVSLKGSITRYEDERPPRLSAVDVFSHAVDKITFKGEEPMAAATSFGGELLGNDSIDAKDMVIVDGFVAQRAHTVYNFGVSVSF